ncbi:MAG: MBOAT family protein [Trueperaceae bacterium]|nr:MBOAT family protein [Trueperaceae bacterium]
MVFSTNVFLFLFLPLFLALYYLLPFRFRSVLILVASYLFYGWWRIDFLGLFFGVTLWSYLMSLGIVRAQNAGKDQLAKRYMIAGVVGGLSSLAYFKYFNFGLDSLNALLGTMGASSLSAWQVILPIGISFYVFQAVSYVIDVYRKDALPAQNFWDFSAFIALFPQLIAGPVLRYKDVADQFVERTHTVDKFSEGVLRFMIGFAKKVMIADTLAPIADAAFALPQPTMGDAWLGALAYSIQLFFDFSGYSDMAVGLGLMMGFRFMENFNHPYISRSITEFWRRWHISLSSWLRDYLYIPLGGNRKGKVRTYINLFLTMVLGGLWHGANWTFVLWGAWHGGILAIEKRLKETQNRKPMRPYITIPGTLILVIVGWVFFRAANVQAAFAFLGAMIGLHGFALSDAISWQVTGLQLSIMTIAILIIALSPLWLKHLDSVGEVRKQALSHVHLIIIPIFVLAILRLSAQNFSPFLYFQF